jgi:hypothetical protein
MFHIYIYNIYICIHIISFFIIFQSYRSGIKVVSDLWCAGVVVVAFPTNGIKMVFISLASETHGRGDHVFGLCISKAWSISPFLYHGGFAPWPHSPTWMWMWSEGERPVGLQSQSLGRANVHGVPDIACVWAGRVLIDACGLQPKTKKACVTAAAQLVP